MKNIKFKTLVISTCFMLSLNTAFTQQDSLKSPDSLKTSKINNPDTVFYVENCTFSYFEAYNIKDSITIKELNQPSEKKLYNISKITFKKDNNLDLLSTSGKSTSVNLKYANEFKMNKGTELLSGAILGACSGALLGLVIGSIADNNGTATQLYSNKLGKPVGVLLGALIGGIIGGVIGNSIYNEEFINLKRINENNRQRELIEFIKRNE